MRRRIVSVLGAGSHGFQLAEILRERGLHPVMYDDFRPGFPKLREAPRRFPYVIGAAWPEVRWQIWCNGGRPNYLYGARGEVVFPGAHIGADVELGEHTHVEFAAVVSHGCRLRRCVTVCPGAVLAGDVTVGDRVLIGANATVLHGGITIGDGAVIGAGAVVTRDVPAGVTVKGSPAK